MIYIFRGLIVSLLKEEYIFVFSRVKYCGLCKKNYLFKLNDLKLLFKLLKNNW